MWRRFRRLDRRRRLPGLCDRDPDQLDGTGIARATVESVAENTSDAIVAPLFWGAVAGIPGLLAYRAVNTLDAMVGHRSARYERFGWAAARLDDVANWAPARLTALLTAALAPWAGGSASRALRTLRRDGAAHPSPDAGRCEAASRPVECDPRGSHDRTRGGMAGGSADPGARTLRPSVLRERGVVTPGKARRARDRGRAVLPDSLAHHSARRFIAHCFTPEVHS